MGNPRDAYVKKAILKALAAAPSGKTAAELCIIVERDKKAIASRLYELLDTGRVAMCSGGFNRKVWYAPKHVETARAAAEREG